MGFRAAATEAVGAVAKAEAQAAALAGQRVYVPVLAKASALAAGVDVWGQSIEAIEAAGWLLTSWAIDPAGNARPVFRRIEP